MKIIPSSRLSEQDIIALRQIDPNDKKRLLWTDAQYFADKGFITNSMLKELDKGGPLHFLKYIEKTEQEEKDHFTWGSAFHCAIGEPNEFGKRYFVFNDAAKVKEIGGAKPRNTNKYQDWKAEELAKHIGKKELDLYDYESIMTIRDRMFSIPQIAELLKYCVYEHVYHGELEGVPVKCKPDGLNKGNYGVEFKSSKDTVTHKTFSKEINYLDYDRQTAFYKDILGVPEYYWIAVEKTHPYNIGLYRMDRNTYERGQQKYKQCLRAFNYYFRGAEKFNRQQFFYSGNI